MARTIERTDAELDVEQTLRAGRVRTALLVARAHADQAGPAVRARLRLLVAQALAADGRPHEGLAAVDDAWLTSLEAGAELDAAARARAYGECLLALGDAAGAVEQLHVAWRTEAARGDALRASEAALTCAQALIQTDRADLGRRAADAARAVFASAGRPADAARCDLTIARAHERTGHLPEARAAAEAAARELARHATTTEAAAAHRVAARLCLADGATDRAVELLERALGHYGADRHGLDAATCRLELAEALVELGLHRSDHDVIAAALPWFAAAFDGFVTAHQPRQAAASARREAWTLHLLGRALDARIRLDETTATLRRTLG